MSADQAAAGDVARHVTAILVEGRSDEAAVRAAATLLGCDLDASGVAVVPIGGATAIRHAIAPTKRPWRSSTGSNGKLGRIEEFDRRLPVGKGN